MRYDSEFKWSNFIIAQVVVIISLIFFSLAELEANVDRQLFGQNLASMRRILVYFALNYYFYAIKKD